MKNKFLLIMLILLFPLSVFAVENLSTIVSIDYTGKGLERLNVKFTSKGVNATAETQTDVSNYEDYTGLPDLTYAGEVNPVAGILLKSTINGNEVYAESKNSCYISWQTYTKDSAKVYLSVDGPLKSKTSQIHWQVYMDASTLNKQVADSAVPKSRIEVVTTLPGNFGVAGSRQFHVKTASLLQHPFESYKANIVATVEAI